MYFYKCIFINFERENFSGKYIKIFVFNEFKL